MTPAEKTREETKALFAGHSKLPWHWTRDGDYWIGNSLSGCDRIAQLEGKPAWGNHANHAEANAKLICHAVNCHDDLLEALRGLLVEYCQHIPEDVTCPKVRKAADTARAAIAKAEGQQ